MGVNASKVIYSEFKGGASLGTFPRLFPVRAAAERAVVITASSLATAERQFVDELLLHRRMLERGTTDQHFNFTFEFRPFPLAQLLNKTHSEQRYYTVRA